jgi:3-deoxy-D-manno-octulosonic acid kinase
LTETVERTATGAILYDQSVINQISERHFTADGWPHSSIIESELRSGGRGNTLYVGNVPRQFVLRHYRRGGMIGKVVSDTYAWKGEDATRSFAEWRMLKKMADFNLRVPRPAAARYVRRGPFYTADLITVRIPGVRALSQVITGKSQNKDFWAGVGAGIQEFHAAGVYHADMNAYNIQIDDDGRLWMLDFDKGRLRPPGRWQQQTLDRLQRSLNKIQMLDAGIHFKPGDWEALLDGYFSASRSA